MWTPSTPTPTLSFTHAFPLPSPAAAAACRRGDAAFQRARGHQHLPGRLCADREPAVPRRGAFLQGGWYQGWGGVGGDGGCLGGCLMAVGWWWGLPSSGGVWGRAGSRPHHVRPHVARSPAAAPPPCLRPAGERPGHRGRRRHQEVPVLQVPGHVQDARVVQAQREGRGTGRGGRGRALGAGSGGGARWAVVRSPSAALRCLRCRGAASRLCSPWPPRCALLPCPAAHPTPPPHPRLPPPPHHPSLQVEAGSFTDSEIIVMLGENGTGKTTFIRMLAGMLKPGAAAAAAAAARCGVVWCGAAPRGVGGRDVGAAGEALGGSERGSVWAPGRGEGAEHPGVSRGTAADGTLALLLASH